MTLFLSITKRPIQVKCKLCTRQQGIKTTWSPQHPVHRASLSSPSDPKMLIMGIESTERESVWSLGSKITSKIGDE